MPVRATFVAKRFAVPNKYANFALGLSHALQGGGRAEGSTALRGKRGRQDTYIMAKAYLALWF